MGDRLVRGGWAGGREGRGGCKEPVFVLSIVVIVTD